MSKKIKQKKGFTIIEVVLVLAIAGLIFLMVFVVVPQAMAGQRDGERRQAMSRVQSALVQYQTNNKSKRNNLPLEGNATEPVDKGFCTGTTACSFIQNYMNASGAEDNLFIDPDGVPYNMVITENYALAKTSGVSNIKYNDNSTLDGSYANGYTIGGTDPYKEHVIYIVPGGQCSGENVIKSELRHFAVLYRLEGSGTYCGDSD